MKKLAIIAASFLAMSSLAAAAPPIEAYGELPDISGVALSPDGKHNAAILRKGGEEFFVVSTISGEYVGSAHGDFKARRASFADSRHAIFHASETTSQLGFRGKWEHSGAISFNLETKKLKLLLKNTKELFPAQSGLGRIVGRHKKTNEVFMPAFSGSYTSNPSYDLFAVDLDSGQGRIHAKGSQSTDDWFVDEDGTVLAREESMKEIAPTGS